MSMKQAKKMANKVGRKRSTKGRIDFDALTKDNVKQVFAEHAARTRPLMQKIDQENFDALQRMRNPGTRALTDEVRKLKAKVKKLESALRKQ